MPINTASVPWHTARAQRAIGIDARVWEFGFEPTWCAAQQGVEFVRIPANYRSAAGLAAIARFVQVMRWADVVHWYSGARLLPRDLDLRLVALHHPARVIEWTGSDIRDPMIEALDNPVLLDAMGRHPELKSIWCTEGAHHRQRVFAEAGFVSVCARGMKQYVLPDLQPGLHVVDRALVLDDYTTAYPDVSCSRPVIAHAPSKPALKGTEHVLGAASSLARTKHFDLDLITAVPHNQALARISKCDIFVDQLILGDFGMAALEAMAMGKPVVAYVKPALRALYPKALPVVDASPDSIELVLATLLSDGRLRHELGQQGRRYVERHAGARNRAASLEELYESLMARSPFDSRRHR